MKRAKQVRSILMCNLEGSRSRLPNRRILGLIPRLVDKTPQCLRRIREQEIFGPDIPVVIYVSGYLQIRALSDVQPSYAL